MPMATAATRKAVPVPAILLAMAVLACLLIAHGLYGLLELFGAPDLSPEATLLTVLALCFLLLLLLAAAAASAGNRRALLPREEPAGGGDHVDVIYGGGSGGGPKVPVLPTTAEEPHHQLAGDEEMREEAEARRAGLLQTQDYPGSGANSRHDPRNPH